MTLVKFIEIISAKIWYLILLPVITGLITFLMVKDLPQQYQATTTIYTGITTNSGLEVNDRRVDKYVNQNEYSNILALFKSDAIYEEISLRLLASHLILSKPDKYIISTDAFNDLKKNVPEKIRKLVVRGDEEQTYQNLRKSVQEDEKNYLYSILNYVNPYYSISALQNLKVEQVNSSDMIKFTYQCNDPGICYNTTRIAAKVFISQYGRIKKNIKTSAVKYFQKKLAEITGKLNNSEDQLLNFNIENKIINYYEQTKQVTTQNEEIELKLQDAKMNFVATTAVLRKLESEIAKRFAINLKNVEILNIRSQLVACNSALAQGELNQNTGSVKLQELKERKKILEDKMASKLDSIYHFESNSQGIEYQRLLLEWLTAVNNYETYAARFKSMQERRVEFAKEFQRYAPLGATSKRIEREIGVHENEYMNILNNLNVALQNEQNTDMISNMHIIDEARFPIAAQASKKKLYIIIAMLFTVLFYLLSIFSIELMDHRVKTPELLRSHTGWDVIGAFCLHSKKFINTEQITQKAGIFIYEKIRLLSEKTPKPFVIQIVSNWDGAGKSYSANILSEELSRRGYNVATLNFMSVISDDKTGDEKVRLDTEKVFNHYLTANTYAELLKGELTNYDYIISVIPSVSRGIDNPVLLKTASLNLFVFNACLSWGTSDTHYVSKIKELVGDITCCVLTNAQPNDLEELYGDIPKKRSKFRKGIKSIVKRFTKY